MNKLRKVFATALAFAPGVVLAAGGADNTIDNVGDLMDTMLRWINDILIPLLIAVAVIVFFWGIIKYISTQGDAAKRSEARHLMLWGIIALFVMVSVWGLVGLLSDTLATDSDAPPGLPRVE